MRIEKFFVAFVFALLVLPALADLSISPGIGTHTHSDDNTGGGTLALSGSLTSTKACATGFVRVSPNYCEKDPSVLWNYVTLTRDACTTVAVTVGATYADVIYSIDVGSGGGQGLRNADIVTAKDGTCVLSYRSVECSVREFSSVSAGTTIGICTAQRRVPVDASGNIFMKLTDDTANQGFGQYLVIGYGD